MASQRQMIEDAILITIADKFRKACNPTDGYLDFVGPYNGEFDQAEGPQDFIRRVKGRYPMVMVGARSAVLRGESVARSRFARVHTMEIYVGSDNMRDRESQTRSDVVAEQDPTADPGCFQIVEDLHELIAGNDFADLISGVDYAEPTREEILIQEPGFTIWRMQFTIDADAHVKPRDFGDVSWTSYAIDANLDGDEVATPPNPFVEADGTL